MTRLQADEMDCLACYGFHTIQNPKLAADLMCRQCHEETDDVYKESVHGAAVALGLGLILLILLVY